MTAERDPEFLRTQNQYWATIYDRTIPASYENLNRSIYMGSRPHSAAWYRIRHYSRALVYTTIGVFCAGVWFAVIWGVVAFVRAWGI